MYVPKTQPYDHQVEALLRAHRRPGFGFLMEMGTGKSKVIVDELSELVEEDEIDCALIVAPKGVYGNWKRKEIPAHMPDRVVEQVYVHLWEGMGTARERAAWRVGIDSGKKIVLIVNVEALASSQRAADFVVAHVRSGRCYIAVDEASTIKNPTAQRTKFLLKLARLATTLFRRIATGSPVPRGPLDLWSQFEFLEPGCLGHRSFYSYRGRYAVTQRKEFGGRSVEVVVGYRNVDELNTIVSRQAYIVRKEDCLTLPPKVFITRDVELTPEQRRVYDDVRDWATAELRTGDFVSATVVITQMLRLHQIVCGHVVDELGVEHELPTRRLDALSEVMAESGERAIVWCNYRSDVCRAVERLRADGLRVVEYHGGTSDDDRAEAIARIQGQGDPSHPSWRWGPDGVVPEADRADVFVGTPHAGGYGITLTEASLVVYYSNNYDLEKRAQSEDRAHRIGQTRTVTYVDLVARGTVDEKIIAALHSKQQMADLIMRGPEAVRELLS